MDRLAAPRPPRLLPAQQVSGGCHAAGAVDGVWGSRFEGRTGACGGTETAREACEQHQQRRQRCDQAGSGQGHGPRGQATCPGWASAWPGRISPSTADPSTADPSTADPRTFRKRARHGTGPGARVHRRQPGRAGRMSTTGRIGPAGPFPPAPRRVLLAARPSRIFAHGTSAPRPGPDFNGFCHTGSAARMNGAGSKPRCTSRPLIAAVSSRLSRFTCRVAS